MPIYEWYEVVTRTTPFEQGDFFDNVPIPILTHWDFTAPVGNPVHQAQVERHNLVLMTQSCDLIKYEDTDHVLLCPRLDYRLAEERNKGIRGKDGWKNLIAGRVIGIHILNMCEIEQFQCDYQIVDLRRVFSMPMGFLKDISSPRGRLRLLPPYREHLSQSFARQFMRVGLPIDLPREYPGKER
ncbi:conserved protein of unknown function [Candidatus Promineifilum breve]|jgi:hypothetical protein|uniref:Uncharacterized protein n=1 Tax=Candidatus Promineifilum breve TaxID=1806508 RepID=A0A160T7Q7_9CHLR|nr:hypothetical protein [Candidatus Promineifilum breve]CUS05388.2 conserved protein of unknown function [Candidatus Promineifilum breve]